MSSIRITPLVNAGAIGKQGAIEASKSGIWAGMFAITMSFAALSSALFVREGSAVDWQHIDLPRILNLNTVVLILSSCALERSRRFGSGRDESSPDAVRRGLRWLCAALVLGLLFFAGQLVAWRELASEGIFLATNPNSSFFYVLTAVHGVHLFGGLIALVYVTGHLAASRTKFRRRVFDATAIYWHFMCVLWVYLLMIFRTRL